MVASFEYSTWEGISQMFGRKCFSGSAPATVAGDLMTLFWMGLRLCDGGASDGIGGCAVENGGLSRGVPIFMGVSQDVIW
jgi:hypothetical protein